MASSLNTENEEIVNGDKLDLGKFLKERQSPNPSRDRIVQNSQEKFSQNRQNSADASNLSRSQNERKLDDFLKNKRRHGRRRGKKKLTISDVRAEAAKILEEFLQEQLSQQAIQTSSPEYQRIVEVSVTENTTPSGESSSYLASSSNILRENSIPYADESDTELKKSESLPHDSFVELQRVGAPAGLPIHHEKSRSAPHTQEEDEWRQHPSRRLPGSIQPTPPAPPGTPHTPSENSSNGSASLLHPVPYTGKPTDSSMPCSSDSLGTFNSLERRHSPPKKPVAPSALDTLNLPSPPHSHSRSVTPVTDGETSYGSPTKHSYGKQDKKKKSGWSSSSDTDSAGNLHNHGRKKKSMFKKAQQRMQTFFRQKKNKSSCHDEMDFDDEDGYEGSVDEKRTKPKKKHKKHSKEKHEAMDVADNYVPDDDRKILEERHIQKNKRIHQTHSGEDGRTVIRSEEVSETVDSIDRKEIKHTEKHWKMKESSGQDGSIFGKLRRFTSRDKGKKHSIKESKSAHFGRDEADYGEGNEGSSKYSRATSVPGRAQHSRPTQLGLDETDDANLKMYTNRRGFEFSNVDSQELHPGIRHTTATQVVCREEQEKDIRRHSSHLDIVDHSGQMIERLYFDADGNELPKNKSFSFLQEEDVRERVIDDHGRRRVVRDVTHREHMEVAEESEGGAKKGLDEMNEEEKEELYGKIASRLASIGDNLMSEREDSRSASASPRSKLTDDQKSSPEQEFTKTTLTPLEIELRDELRKVADDMDAMLEANAKKAALHITGLVTYNHFKNIVQDSVGQEQGWAQVAAVFHITKRAMRLAGASGALALQIKEMSLKYIEDTFANWIVGQGGWESMLSDADSETDSELD